MKAKAVAMLALDQLFHLLLLYLLLWPVAWFQFQWPMADAQYQGEERARRRERRLPQVPCWLDLSSHIPIYWLCLSALELNKSPMCMWVSVFTPFALSTARCPVDWMRQRKRGANLPPRLTLLRQLDVLWVERKERERERKRTGTFSFPLSLSLESVLSGCCIERTLLLSKEALLYSFDGCHGCSSMALGGPWFTLSLSLSL